MVDAVLSAGQEVQLHLHPNWIGARAEDRAANGPRGDLALFDVCEQRDLLAAAIDLLVAAGAPRPVAFRAGSYAANDDTLAALAALGLRYDSSHNGAAPAQSRLSLDRRRVSPAAHAGLVEVPVTVIEDAPGSLRTAQVCALSRAEMRDLLDHAVAERHAAVTLASHGFELANRAGTRPNRVHVRRFDALCQMLADRRDVLPTTRFDSAPGLALDRDDRPLAPDALRTGWRRAEQLWSNWVEERAA